MLQGRLLPPLGSNIYVSNAFQRLLQLCPQASVSLANDSILFNYCVLECRMLPMLARLRFWRPLMPLQNAAFERMQGTRRTSADAKCDLLGEAWGMTQTRNFALTWLAQTGFRAWKGAAIIRKGPATKLRHRGSPRDRGGGTGNHVGHCRRHAVPECTQLKGQSQKKTKKKQFSYNYNLD